MNGVTGVNRDMRVYRVVILDGAGNAALSQTCETPEEAMEILHAASDMGLSGFIDDGGGDREHR